jgi:putative PIG3 family NAD(P)H quinone oxidoreductase
MLILKRMMSNATMRGVVVLSEGADSQLKLVETLERPRLGDDVDSDELLVKVKACGVNRADLLQRKGSYPPPKGASALLGLEVSGVVQQAGKRAQQMGFKRGSLCAALVDGGGYCEYVKVRCGQAMEVPSRLNVVDACAVVEAFLTAYQQLFSIGKIRRAPKRQCVLVHAGASGVGTAAIQLAKHANPEHCVIATVRSSSKADACLALGADHVYEFGGDGDGETFDQMARRVTDGRGVDILVDCVGAPYFASNVKAMAADGIMTMIGFLGGAQLSEPVSLLPICRDRISIVGSTLRSRDYDYKRRLMADFVGDCSRAFEEGTLRPVIDRCYDIAHAEQAHTYVAQNRNVGKVLLTF